MKELAFAGLLTGFYFLIPSASEAQTVAQVAQAALENSPSIDQAKASRQAAIEGVLQANAAYRPEVSLNASISSSERDARLRGSSDFSETSEPKSASIRLDQSIYTNGLRPLAKRRALSGVRASRHQYQATQNTIVLDAINALLQIQLARQNVAQEERLKLFVSDQVEAEKARFDLDVGTLTDVSQAEARLASANASLALAKAQLIQAEQELEFLTTFKPAKNIPEVQAPAVPARLEDALRMAGEHVPELAAARANVQTSQLDLISAGKRYGPQVGLTLEASTARTPSPAIDRDDDVRATLSFSLPLYTGGRKSSERREALAQSRAATAALREAELNLQRRITGVWLNFEAAREQIVALSERRDAAEVALEGVRRGRDAGLWSVTDILDAVEQTIIAEQALAEAKTAYLAAAYELSISCGLSELAN